MIRMKQLVDFFLLVNICDGGIITDDSLRIISPVGNNGKYPNNLRCTITIQAPVNKVNYRIYPAIFCLSVGRLDVGVNIVIDNLMFQVISMDTVLFDVEYQQNCRYDYLRVKDSSAGGPKFRVRIEKLFTYMMVSEPMECILLLTRPWTFD